METIKHCLLCEGIDFSLHHKSIDYLVSKEYFSVSSCNHCGFLFTNPLPADIAKYYQSKDYISHHDTEKGLMASAYRTIRDLMVNYKYKIVHKHIAPGSAKFDLLDFGCGTGAFLAKCQETGMLVQGYEPNPDAATAAKEKKLKVFSEQKEFVASSSCNNYNAISLWHVIEHIPDVKNQLKLFHKNLAPNGILILAIPEYNSIDAKFYKSKWAAWDLPRHLYHFNQETLVKAVSPVGFKLEKLYPLVFDSYYISLMSELTQIGKLRAVVIGLISNLAARLKYSPFSSQIYVFRKTKE